MQRKPYSAGAVKLSFWFLEFRQTVALLQEGLSWDEIKALNARENIYDAVGAARARQIFNTVRARICTLEPSFYELFLASDLSTQKLFALVAALAHDTLFFDFVYEVVRENLILGTDELSDADIRIFFSDKAAQSAKVAGFREYTLRRLGGAYKTYLCEAGILSAPDSSTHTRKILRPILDPGFVSWLDEHDMAVMVKTLAGER